MSLSRKYRPQRFADITAQEAAKETLRREVAGAKIGHAYLFSGPRGVGKTTVARIFAKALNCRAPKDGEPCDACEMCQAFRESRMVDVIEIDAASHTGVDMIREAIIEHVRFAPSVAPHKIYILDEAHMLSTAAWNALLKTLEEPPAYAVFMLATTELHRVPATIVSRCQRFDFKRVSLEALVERLETVAKGEGVSVAPEVMRTIARQADGCVRDAETLLGQLCALGEKKITAEMASLVMPMSRLPLAAGLLELCGKRQLAPVLTDVGRIEDEGIPLLPLFDDLIEATRWLLLEAEDAKISERLAAGDEGEQKLATLRGVFQPAELGEMALVLMERRRDAKQGIDARFALELAMTAITLGVLPHGPNSTGGGPSPADMSMTTGKPIVPRAAFVKKTEPRIDTKPESKPEPEAPQTRAAAPVPSVEPPAVSSVSDSAAVPSSMVDDSSNADFTLGTVLSNWMAILQAVGEKNASLVFILRVTRPVSVSGNRVVLGFQYPFHRDKIVNDGKNRRVVEEAIALACHVPSVVVEAVIGEDPERAAERSTDMVTNILKAFGGQVIDDSTSPATGG